MTNIKLVISDKVIAFDDSEMRNLPPVLLAHGHFEPSALLSVLASTRTWVGFGGFGPFWEFIWAKGTEGSDYSKARA